MTRALENSFYDEYRKFREKLDNELLAKNGPATPRFPGTNGRLVRLAQKILDRCLFFFFFFFFILLLRGHGSSARLSTEAFSGIPDSPQYRSLF